MHSDNGDTCYLAHICYVQCRLRDSCNVVVMDKYMDSLYQTGGTSHMLANN
jgi:hypothetical protein